jgi:putative hydrolase of the HAD superfamily
MSVSNTPAVVFNPHALKAILFDMDDTLYPERTFVLSGFRAVADWAEVHCGIPAGEGYARLESLFVAGARGDTFNRWLADFAFREAAELVPQLVQVYREHRPTIRPFPEVPTLLTSLRQTYRLGLITDGYLAVQRRKLAALRLDSLFEVVVFSDEWGRQAWKPAAQPYEAALSRLMLSPGEVVYVADNPRKDFFGARQVGMWAVWLRLPQGEYAHIQPPSPHHESHVTVSSWPELMGFFLD